MKEYKIGEKIVLEVQEQPEDKQPCEGCFFADEDTNCIGECSYFERSDGKNVIFKEVKPDMEV